MLLDEFILQVSTVGIGVGTVGAVASLAGAIADNRKSLPYDAPDAERLTAVQQAITAWFFLPGSAYVLAIFTNIGTTFILDEDLDTQTWGWRVLTGGISILTAIAFWAIRQTEKAKNSLSVIQNWPVMLSEARRGERVSAVADSDWLALMEDKFEVLDQSTTRRDRRDSKALDLLGPTVASRGDWRVIPTRGLATYSPIAGHGRVNVGLLVVTKWLPTAWIFLTLFLLQILGAAGYYILAERGWGAGAAVRASYGAAALLLATLPLTWIACRAQLIFSARRAMRDRAYRLEVQQILVRIRESLRAVDRQQVQGAARPVWLARAIYDIRRVLSSSAP